MDQDLEHLKLLSIFHYVVGGMMALFACFPLLHLILGLALATGVLDDAPPESQVVGVVIMVVAGLMILLGWTMAIAVLLAGRKLSQRTGYTFCLVIAGIECFFMPFGTILGVFTLIVLVRENVKRQFDVPAVSGYGKG